MIGTGSDRCFVYFDKVLTLAGYIKELYTTQGANGLYYHGGSLENGISDGSYRYAGASTSVNNYVCFGSTATTCSDDNKYRIIGVFGDQVKLIKSISIGDMAWDNNGSHTWVSSTLNTYLNGDYLATTWSSMINTTSWKVGGRFITNIGHKIPKIAYTNEITSTSTTYGAQIGLMYVSDYGLAADPSAWTEDLFYYSYSTATSNNLMYLGSYEWTITPAVDFSNSVFAVFSDGRVGADDVITDVSDAMAVRPVFYLTSSITYASGTGTSTDPIRIN